MSELNFVGQQGSRDFIAEGGHSEYYASHFEDRLVSAAWTCERDGLMRLLHTVITVTEGEAASQIDVRMTDGEEIETESIDELVKLAYAHGDVMESVIVRRASRLFFWSRTPSASETSNPDLGEVSIITEAADAKTLSYVVSHSASPMIGKYATMLTAHRNPRSKR
ncbi:hypothetical protein GCM10027289_16130 [Tsukamurella serpentis]